MAAMLVLFRMPDDHDLVHDRHELHFERGIRDSALRASLVRPMLAHRPGSDNMIGAKRKGARVCGGFGRAVAVCRGSWPWRPCGGGRPPRLCIASLRSATCMAISPPGADIARAAQLVDDRGRWIGGDTVLVQTGDVVDRGPDSLKIIQDLMRLQQEAPARPRPGHRAGRQS